VKKSKAETAETRKRIVKVASEVFRSNGINATGVSEIMSAVGLTHGGFYRHFDSKEQLVAEACAESLEVLAEGYGAAADKGEMAFLKVLEHYLSAEYRDSNECACPLVANGSELARADKEIRQVATRGFENLIEIIAKRYRANGSPTAKADALFTLTAMIGAGTMARVVDDPELSDQIFQVTRKRLASRAGKPQRKLA
jgi:TetR/AcrR family transcriptional regulator, transcriptional repressor for nem operon